MRFFIIPDALYNLDVEGFGLLKLKPTPMNLRWPSIVPFEGHLASGVLYAIQWFYAPWHRVRVSMGEGLPYVGGFTIPHAVKSLCDVYGEESVRRHGKDNAEEFEKERKAAVSKPSAGVSSTSA